MPVKVRCPGCQKVLNAPDQARGKAIRCPNCEERIRVPAGEGAAAPSSKSASSAARKKPAKPAQSRKPARAAATADEDNFLSDLDLRRVEDQQVRICPKCAAEVDEEDVICHACGVDLATGELSEQERKKRSRRGPDPAEFYSNAWSESWEFLMNHKNWAVRTGLYWTLFFMLYLNATFMVAWVDRMPPKVFWMFLASLFSMGIAGWYWFLSIEIITLTLARKKRIKRLDFDFFSCIALGFKAFAWPYIMLIPVSWFPPLWILPAVAFPVAMIHFSMPYTYKAWLPWDLLKIFAKNAAPTLYWQMMALAVNLVLFGVSIVFAVFFVPIFAWVSALSVRFGMWFLELVGENPSEDSWMVIGLAYLTANIMGTVFLMPFLIGYGFSSVFLMRANGLLAYYRRETLDLVNDTDANKPAGFWVRYLAAMVDFLLLPLTSFLIFKNKLSTAVIWVYNVAIFASWFYELAAMMQGLVMAWPLINAFLYFVLQEGSPERQTVGKHAFGLIVVDMQGKELTPGLASKRFFCKLLSCLTLGFGFAMAGFTEKKQALHDIMAGTQVVWKGETK